jgi:hypothetical protein
MFRWPCTAIRRDINRLGKANAEFAVFATERRHMEGHIGNERPAAMLAAGVASDLFDSVIGMT